MSHIKMEWSYEKLKKNEWASFLTFSACLSVEQNHYGEQGLESSPKSPGIRTMSGFCFGSSSNLIKPRNQWGSFH